MAKIYTKATWTDEVLAGTERYNILEDEGTPIEENVQIVLDTSVAIAGTAVDADKMNNIEDGVDALDTLVYEGLTGKNTETLADDLVLADTDPILQYLDPGGAARNVTLPAEDPENHNFIIINTADAAETITVMDDDEVTIGTVAQNEAKIFVSNGTVWRQLTTGSAGSGGADILEVQVFS